MGLRDFLANLQGVTAATAGAAESTGKLRQELAMQQYQQQLPSIIESGDQKALASAAAGAGDMEMLRMLLGNQQKLQAKEAPASEEYLVGQEAASGMKLPRGLPQSQIDKILSTGQTRKGLEQKASDSATKETRLTGNKLKDDAAKFAAPLIKSEKEINDSISALNTAAEAFNEPGGATGQAANLVVRSLIKAAGDSRVSDQDIAGLTLKSLPSKSAELLNYFTGKTDQALTEAEKAELNRIVAVSKRSAENRKDKVLGEQFLSAANAYKHLVEGDNAAVLSFAEKLGLEKPTIDENGIVRAKKRQKISKEKNGEGPLPLWTDKLPQDVKNLVFQQTQDVAMTPEKWDKVKANIKKVFKDRNDLGF